MDMTASIMMFYRYTGKNLTFCYTLDGNAHHSQIVIADAVIMIRLPIISPLNDICRLLNIPCYYFTDDNFREIVVDNDDKGAIEAAKQTTKENLAQFRAVLVTTERLRDYFLKENLHDNVIKLSAVWRRRIESAHGTRPFTVAFMGGVFREGVVEACILPALYMLSKERPLRFICPCDKETEGRTLSLAQDNLEIIPFHRTSNYEYLLNSYGELGVDILVHCGANLRNNVYKTKNALLNAVTLGAVLAISDIEPYNDVSDGSDGTYMLVRNTPKAWTDALRRLADDPDLRRSIYDRAAAFCEENNSSEAAWADLEEEFAQCAMHDDFYYFKRYEKLCDWMILNSVGGNVGAAIVKTYRSYNPEKLSYTGEITSPRRFGFTSPVQNIREVGLLFAVTGKCSGCVELRFYKRGIKEPVSTVFLDIASLKENGYTNILLTKPISARKKELLHMEIDIHYEIKNGFVGLFEDRDRRTLFYKIFNKLGRPIPGKNALFIDCRC
jgi:hypothetical protein